MASGITDDKTLYMVPQASKNTIQRVWKVCCDILHTLFMTNAIGKVECVVATGE